MVPVRMAGAAGAGGVTVADVARLAALLEPGVQLVTPFKFVRRLAQAAPGPDLNE